jgi:Stage II sporulation protein M
MNQQDFERQHAAYWQATEALITGLSKDKGANPNSAGEFPQHYRQVCQHLALARERQYTSHLIEHLNQLMLRGHQHLYGSRAGFLSPILHFIGAAFPALIRREWRLFWLAFLLFYGPLALMGWAVYERPEMSYTLMNAAQVSQMEAMYSPDAPHIGHERGAENDVYMFGVYIWNNIRIGFQTFAGGIFFGVGSIFFLVFNGLYIGAVAGHLTQVGYTSTFWFFRTHCDCTVRHGGAKAWICLTGARTANARRGFARSRQNQYQNNLRRDWHVGHRGFHRSLLVRFHLDQHPSEIQRRRRIVELSRCLFFVCWTRPCRLIASPSKCAHAIHGKPWISACAWR